MTNKLLEFEGNKMEVNNNYSFIILKYPEEESFDKIEPFKYVVGVIGPNTKLGKEIEKELESDE